MLTVESLLAAHDSAPPTPAALVDNMFDALLIHSNPVYRQLREQCVNAGVQFSSKPSPLWAMYAGFPLLCLPSILATQTLPYLDNVTPLRHVANRHPDLQVSLRFVADHFHRNQIFHESCHFIANEIIFADAADFSGEELGILHLLGEASSLSIFDFCAMLATSKTEILGCIFNYVPVISEPIDIFRRALDRFGAKQTIALYAVWNVCCLARIDRERLSPRLVCAAVQMVALASDEGLVAEIGRAAYAVDESFVGETQSVYFQLARCPRPTSDEVLAALVRDAFRRVVDAVSNRLASVVESNG